MQLWHPVLPFFGWSWVQTRPGHETKKCVFFLFSFFSSQGKARLKKTHYTFFLSGCVRAYIFLFSFFSLAIARLYPPPKGVFHSFFRPPVTKTTCQLTFSLSGGANKSCSTLIYVHWPRLTKRFDSFRSFLRFWTLKMLWGAKRRIFMKNRQKWIFSYWSPSVRRERDVFFFYFFLFLWFKGVLEHGLGRLHWNF